MNLSTILQSLDWYADFIYLLCLIDKCAFKILSIQQNDFLTSILGKMYQNLNCGCVVACTTRENIYYKRSNE